MDYRLQQLEKKSVYIIREARTKFKNVILVCSTDQDSALLSFLCKKAFFGKTPFPTIKESELAEYEFDDLVRPLAVWQEQDVRQYIKYIKESKTVKSPKDQSTAKEKEKKEIIERLRKLGYT